jgi:hypothetical protein
MDDIGGVTDETLAAQMGILSDNEVADSGEDTVNADSEDDVYFSGRGTHNPVAPEFKYGAHDVYLGPEYYEMCLGYVVTVHGDREGCVFVYS